VRNINVKKVLIPLLLLISIFIAGIIGYMLIEGLSVFEAWYMTVNAISTSGFGEIKVLSYRAKFFTTILILASFGIFGYVITMVAQHTIDGNFQKYFKHVRLNSKIQKLSDHVVICGYGRNGRQVAKELRQFGQQFVVIEMDEQRVEAMSQDPDLLLLHGNATNDDMLIAAGIKRARALITVLPSDADNLFVVLTAREMNQRLTIVSRASYSQSEHKLKLAGATNVIMPGKIGGSRMAKLVIQPDVVEFLEFVMHQNANNVTIAELSCNQLDKCSAERMSIRQLRVRTLTGANIIGIKTHNGEYNFNPSPDTLLSCSDKLFALGKPNDIEKLRELLQGKMNQLNG
jgi:voltage-gated potassium channel